MSKRSERYTMWLVQTVENVGLTAFAKLIIVGFYSSPRDPAQ